MTRLLDDEVQAAGRAGHLDGLVHEPALVGVGDSLFAVLQHRRQCADAFHVGLPVIAHLNLELAVAVPAQVL
ncbi:hypothetical protein D3C81_1917570 [compost metagenome]